jgi:hypothetical protein
LLNPVLNLVKVSSESPNYTGGPSRASGESTLPISGESSPGTISRARWNKALLLPAKSASDFTPVAPVTDAMYPKWVYVNRSGLTTNGKTKWTADATNREVVVGRFAYAIYNEGGLLDASVAGYPHTVTTTAPADAPTIKNQTGYKSSLAYADLTQIPGLDQGAADKFVQWRNSATLSTDPSGNFLSYATANPGKFLTAFGPPAVGHADQAIISRQQLINYFTTQLGGGAVLQSLQYLGTFSRYLNQPSYWPNPQRPRISQGPAAGDGTGYLGGNDATGKDDAFNPAFGKIRVTTPFLRNDGSRAVPGEPLVKKRFALNRLLWLTSRGPSAGVPAGDDLFQQYRKLGMAATEVERLRAAGTPENIEKYFGLRWTPSGASGYWVYFQGNGAEIAKLSDVLNAGREPNFFELLQAGINVGSIAKSYGDGARGNVAPYTCTTDSYVVWQVLQIGANIIDGANPTCFPTQIQFGAGGGERKIFGSMDMPYLYAVKSIALVNQWATTNPPMPTDRTDPTPLAGTVTTPGKVVFLKVPIVWNPYAPEALPEPIPASLVPKSFRIVAEYKTPGGVPVIPLQPQVKVVDLSGTTKWQNRHIPVPAWNESNTGLIFDNDYAAPTPPPPSLYPASALYREPTFLMRKGFPTGSNLRLDTSSLVPQEGLAEVNSGSDMFVGFQVDSFDQAWLDGGKVCYANEIQVNPQSPGETYRLQYQTKVGGPWITYQEVYAVVDGGDIGVPDRAAASVDVLTSAGIFSPNAESQSTYPNCRWDADQIGTKKAHWPSRNLWDPRSGRWGTAGGLNPTASDPLYRIIDLNLAAVQSLRPTSRLGDGMQDIGNATGKGWTLGNRFGGVSQNLKGTPELNYTDPDGVVRRAMGGALGQCADKPEVDNGLAPLGLPMASLASFAGFKNSPAYSPTPNQYLSRPTILHRPYRNVAELGYVFRGTPWKNIDFAFSESGDSALLDVFCIDDGESADALAAGKIDLNTRQAPVLKAVLSGTANLEAAIANKTPPSGVNATLTPSETANIANALITRTTGTGTLTNLGDVVGYYKAGASNSNSAPYDGFTEDLLKKSLYDGDAKGIQTVLSRFRETAIRSLTGAGMVGTWNLMIDLVAQSGRYTGTQFVPEGEKRYWVHVAIDRQTAKVIDQQIEEVAE